MKPGKSPSALCTGMLEHGYANILHLKSILDSGEYVFSRRVVHGMEGASPKYLKRGRFVFICGFV